MSSERTRTKDRLQDQFSWEYLRMVRRERQQRKREERLQKKALRQEMKIRKRVRDGERDWLEILK